MNTEDVVQRLDRLIALTELAYATEISRARDEMRSDPVTAAILDSTEDWSQSGPLKTKVSTATGSSEKTVQRRISELVEKRFLLVDGSGPSRRVKNASLI